jgi:hypothetical protein
MTGDRRSEKPSRRRLLRLHSKGTPTAPHLVSDIRPRIGIASIRRACEGESNASSVPSALKTVEDFTGLSNALHLRGDPVIATKRASTARGGSQVHDMAEFKVARLPSAKLGLDELDPAKPPRPGRRADALLRQAQCATCHTPPYYTDLDAQPARRRFSPSE